MINIKKLSAMAIIFAAFALPMTSAQAVLVNLSFGPGDADWTSNETSNLTASEVEGITGLTNVTFGVYKQDVGGAETGTFAGSYTTTFSNSAMDPEDALIQLDMGATPLTCGVCVLIVKDGNQTPAQYLFDLSGVGMIESITLTGFWPNQGAISHVELVTASAIPVPAAVWLFGTALIGFIGMSRRTKV